MAGDGIAAGPYHAIKAIGTIKPIKAIGTIKRTGGRCSPRIYAAGTRVFGSFWRKT